MATSPTAITPTAEAAVPAQWARADPRRAQRLPDTVRRQWVSAAARAAWEGRLARIAATWAQLEVQTVLAGLRAAALVAVGPAELVERTRRWAALGLVAVPWVGRPARTSSYSARGEVVAPGVAPAEWTVLVGWPDAVLRVAALASLPGVDVDDLLGAALGYPACCRAHFREVWVGRGSRDPTPWMGGWVPQGDGIWVASGDWRTVMAGRWVGVRPVPHLPCALTCAATQALADVWARELRALDPEVAAWHREVLGWPAAWVAAHGYVEIRWPVLTVLAPTDWTPGLLELRWPGDRPAPPETPRGLVFPLTVAARRVRDHPTQARATGWVATSDEEARLNGFPSAAACDRAHAVVVRVARQARARRVLDLGAGTGLLLRRVGGEVLWALERDAAKLAGRPGIRPVVADLLDTAAWPADWDLALLMPGRLIEAAGDPRTAAVRRCLAGRAVVLYAYGDWLARGPGLRALAAQAGCPVPDAVGPDGDPGVAEAVWIPPEGTRAWGAGD